MMPHCLHVVFCFDQDTSSGRNYILWVQDENRRLNFNVWTKAAKQRLRERFEMSLV